MFVSKASEVDFEFSGAQEGHITLYSMQTQGVWFLA